MGTLKKIEWTEKRIQQSLKLHFLAPNTKKYEITNLYVFGWESDYLAITKSGVFYEIEIKVSKADFNNDFKNKQDKHLLFEQKGKLGKYSGWKGMPNYFYYAVPENLISKDEVPEYAGLIYVKWAGIEIVKEPKPLFDGKIDIDSLNLRDKFYYNMLSWQSKFEKLSEYDKEIKGLKKINWQLQKEIMAYDDDLSSLRCDLDEAQIEIKKLKDEIARRDNEASKGTVSEI